MIFGESIEEKFKGKSDWTICGNSLGLLVISCSPQVHAAESVDEVMQSGKLNCIGLPCSSQEDETMGVLVLW